MNVDDIVQDTNGDDFILNFSDGEKYWVLFSDNSTHDRDPPFTICNMTIRPNNLVPKKKKTGPSKPRGRPRKVPPKTSF